MASSVRFSGRYDRQQILKQEGDRHVWLAYDVLLQRQVVIKGRYAFGSTPTELVEELQRLHRVRHPRIAQGYELGWAAPWTSDDDRPFHFFTQELLEGESLTALRGKLSVAEVRALAVELLELVAFLHSLRLIRLDLKAAHLIRVNGHWKLIDLDQARVDRPLALGELSGTLQSVAPEILQEKPADLRSDLYSVGVLLYEALTGHAPALEGRTLKAVAAWLVSSPVPELPASVVGADEGLKSIVGWLLKREPSDRPGSAEEVLEALTGTPGAGWRLRCPLPCLPLEEREDALTQAQQQLQTLHSRGGGCLSVQGPALSGLSRYLQALHLRSVLTGHPVLLLDARDLTHTPLRIIQVIVGWLELQLGLDNAEWREEAPTPLLSSEAERGERRVLHWIQRLGQAGMRASQRHWSDLSGPVERLPLPVILIDRAAEADRLSRKVLERVTAASGPEGLLWVIAESSEPSQGHGGEAAGSPALVSGQTAQITLNPLSAQGIRACVEATIGPGALRSAEQLQQLHRLTRGLPAVLERVLIDGWRSPTSDWLEALRQYEASHELALADGSVCDQIESHQTILGVLKPLEIQGVLLASLLEPSFPLWAFEQSFCALAEGQVWESYAGACRAAGLNVSVMEGQGGCEPGANQPLQTNPSPLRVLEALTAQGLLVDRRADQPEIFQQSDASLIREVWRLLRTKWMPAPLKIHLFQVIGEVYEQRQLMGMPIALEVLVRAFLSAGQTTRARPYFLAALEALVAVGRLEEGAELLTYILGQLKSTDPQRPELLRRLGELLLELNAPQKGLDYLTQALALADSGAVPGAGGAAAIGWRARLHAASARALVLLSRNEEAARAWETALTSISTLPLTGAGGPTQPSQEGLRLEVIDWRHRQVFVLKQLRQWDAARRALEQAEALQPPPGSVLEARQLYLTAFLDYDIGAPIAAQLTGLQQALTLALSLHDVAQELTIRNQIVRVHRAAGLLLRARDELLVLVSRSHDLFDLIREATALSNLAQIYLELSCHEEALDCLSRAADMYRRLGNFSRELANRIQECDLLIRFEQRTRAEQAFQQLKRLHVQGVASPSTQRLIRLLEVRMQLKEGHLEGLEEALCQLLQPLDRKTDALHIAEFTADLMEVKLLKRQPVAAIRLFAEDILPILGQLPLLLQQRLQSLSLKANEAVVPGSDARWLPPSEQGKERPSTQLHAQPSERPSTHTPERPSTQLHAQPSERPSTQLHAQPSERPPDLRPEPALANTLANTLGNTLGNRSEAAPLPFDAAGLQGSIAQRWPETGSPEPLPPPVRLDKPASGAGTPSAVEGSGDVALRVTTSDKGSTAIVNHFDEFFWLDRIQALLLKADDVVGLAEALAALAGELLVGRGLVFILEDERPVAVRSFRMNPEQADDISRTVIDHVRASGKPVISSDVLGDPSLGLVASLRAASVRSVCCYPIMRGGHCLGVIYVDHPEVSQLTSSRAVAILEKVSAVAADLLVVIRGRKPVDRESTAFGLVGVSRPMQALRLRLQQLARASERNLKMLLTGETGTGKSTIARIFHELSVRHQGRFCEVNCGGVPRSLFESLMFGYVKGAFTGAHIERAGWFELSIGGTLFLDEIGEMPLEQQTSLLTVLGKRRFSRLMSDKEQQFDATLICASNRDLADDVNHGRFRSDLLRRIHQNVIQIPSLRERGPEDIQLLSSHLIHQYLVQKGLMGENTVGVNLEDYVSREGIRLLISYDWPWNVGELENLFQDERIRESLSTLGQQKVNVGQIREVLYSGNDRRGEGMTDISSELQGETMSRGSEYSGAERPSQKGQSAAGARGTASHSNPPNGRAPLIMPPLAADLTYRGLQDTWEEFKGQYIRSLYQANHYNASLTASQLKCSRDLVHRYIKETPPTGGE